MAKVDTPGQREAPTVLSKAVENITSTFIRRVSGAAVAFYFAALIPALLCFRSDDAVLALPAAKAHSQVHRYAAAGFAACLAVKVLNSVLNIDRTNDGDKPSLAIAVIGTTCYLVSGLELDLVFISPYSGSLIHPLRMLTWGVTTNLLVFSLWVSTGTSVTSLVSACLSNVIMLVMGLTSTMASSWLLVSLAFAASSAGLLGSGYFQLAMFEQGISAAAQAKLHRRVAALKKLRALLVFVWSLFPVIFVLQFSFTAFQIQAEMLYCAADLFAKAILQSALSQGIVSWVADQRQRRLEDISLGLVEELREKDRKQALFVASLAHELRTPLNGIVGLTDVLFHSEYHRLSPSAQEMFNTVRSTGQRFQQLVSTILDTVRLDDRKMELNIEEVNPHNLIEDVVLLADHLLGPHTKLEVHKPSNLPMMHGDFNRLVQVLYNLVGNAAKFTEQGVISLLVARDGDNITFRVKDPGGSPPPPPPPPLFAARTLLAFVDSRAHSGKCVSIVQAFASLWAGAHGLISALRP